MLNLCCCQRITPMGQGEGKEAKEGNDIPEIDPQILENREITEPKAQNVEMSIEALEENNVNKVLHQDVRIAPPEECVTKEGTVSLILSLLKGIKIGSDVSSTAVPPSFNLPRSQLQMFAESTVVAAEDLLGACSSGKTPLQRFLAVLKWHISTTRHAVFGKAPYNPTLGETHHISSGDVNMLLEQVSHHPPITALRAESKGIVLTAWHQPVPRFYGSWMEAEVKGRRVLNLQDHSETYISTCPRLSFRFLPVAGSEWVGTTSLKCEETGYEATIEYKAKPYFGLRGESNQISGRVYGPGKKELYKLNGFWDRVVRLRNVESREDVVFFDYSKSVGKMKTPVIQDVEGLASTESILVWSELTNGLLDENWDVSRKAKAKVENEQRRLRKRRKENNIIWKPSFFEADNEGNWVWKDDKQQVARAPIIATAQSQDES